MNKTTRFATTLTLLATVLVLVAPARARAQAPDAGDLVRLGVAFGGISTISATVELVRDSRSLDLAIGTWSFRDLSVSAVVKQYFGAGDARPVAGAGLWLVTAAPNDGRTGFALVLRAPIGVDWAIADRHAAGLVMNVNRGLAVRRSNPDDDLPMNRRLVPLPEVYYRYAR